MTITDDIAAERALLTKSLIAVGPSAPTACGDWTAMDVAAHLVSEERTGGVVTFVGRSLAVRGIPVNDPKGIDKVIRRERRHGFEALIDRLRRPSPRLLLRATVTPATLFEWWTHHDDVAGPNGLSHDVPPHLIAAIPLLMRYHSRRLPANVRLTVSSSDGSHEWTSGPQVGARVAVRGPTADLVRWLAGRAPLTRIVMDGPEVPVQALRAFAGRV